MYTNSSSPFLFRLALHRRGRRVLELEPMSGAAADIRRAEPLRHNALAAELAGVAVDDVAADPIRFTPYGTGIPRQVRSARAAAGLTDGARGPSRRA